jgi:hypothetical protein
MICKTKSNPICIKTLCIATLRILNRRATEIPLADTAVDESQCKYDKDLFLEYMNHKNQKSGFFRDAPQKCGLLWRGFSVLWRVGLQNFRLVLRTASVPTVLPRDARSF